MAIDQCHEQVNAPIKSDGGAVGLTESPQALERWMVAGPEIARVLLEFEASFSTPSDTTTGKHHEQTRSTQLTFAKDVISLLATFEDMGNPFLEDSGDMLTLDTKIVMTKDATRTVNAVEHIGQRQVSEFVEDRLKSASNKPLSDIVSKNKLVLFITPQAKQRSRSKEQFASLKTNCTLFYRLYIACQARQSNLDSFFEHENQACPPSISDMGQLRQGSKSDLMECLTKSSQPASVHPGIDAKVLDGAAIVHMVRPGACRTFEEYSQQMFLPYITSQPETVSRVDIIWDRYLTDSLQQSTRDRRTHSGTTQRQRVFVGAPIPANWEAFLRSNDNKDELFHYLFDCIQACETGRKVIISTKDEAISGCDTVSSFLGRGKKSAWLAWSSCPSVTDAFLDLSLQPTCVNSDTLEKIERFIVIVYSRTCSASGVNGARKELFAQGSRTMENIPPTKAALLQHVRRAAYQAGYVWSHALVPVPVLPSPALWGWLTSDSGWKPFWTELPEASTACYELAHCGCKKGCRRQCKCRASNLQCTELCKCSGACGDNLQ